MYFILPNSPKTTIRILEEIKVMETKDVEIKKFFGGTKMVKQSIWVWKPTEVIVNFINEPINLERVICISSVDYDHYSTMDFAYYYDSYRRLLSPIEELDRIPAIRFTFSDNNSYWWRFLNKKDRDEEYLKVLGVLGLDAKWSTVIEAQDVQQNPSQGRA